MSVTLNCPNCGTQIGFASHEDGYIEHYLYKNDDGKHYCPKCQSGKEIKITGWGCVIFLGVIALIMGLIVAGVKFIESYK